MQFDPTYNPFSLVGKTILITGASSGIGRATAIECSKLGATCVITGRNEERLNETLSQMVGEGHISIVADISTQEGIDLLAEQSPAIDGVVNNAGVGITKPVGFYKQDDLERIFQINAFTPMLITKQLLKKKKINKSASLVFVTSIATQKYSLGNGIYGSSKAAISTYVRYCAKELCDKKIRANSIHPGMIETKLIHGGSLSEADLQKDMQRYPLGRYGNPEEVAHSIIYLLSDASAWITGTSLIIDGGISLV